MTAEDNDMFTMLVMTGVRTSIDHLIAIRQQAITWANVDPDLGQHMASLGPNELTLNMLNCFKDYQRCIHISYHTLDFVQQKKINFKMEQPYMLPTL